MNEDLRKFVLEHQDDDTDKLLLARERWPGIDVRAAVNCILSRRKLRDKVPSWYACDGLFYPNTLSAEQCSGEAAATYKAELLGRLLLAGGTPSAGDFAGGTPSAGETTLDDGATVADLTGGLGVDSWKIAQSGATVLYNEMNAEICAAAVHNFAILGVADKIVCRNVELRRDNISEILDGIAPEVIYLDPARRSSGGGRLFRLEDCSPNLLELAAPLLRHCRAVVAKISPMADISLICKQLEGCGVSVPEVHVVGADGECKELQLVLRAAAGGRTIFVAQGAGRFSFRSEQEKASSPVLVAGADLRAGKLLFEPGKALMKAGAYNLLCTKGLKKLGRSTHLYLADEIPQELQPLGRSFKIDEIWPLDKRSLKELARQHPRCEITARNLPLDSDALRKKMGVASGGDTHIFGIRCDLADSPASKLLLVCRRAASESN